jgi:hypothetical protein
VDARFLVSLHIHGAGGIRNDGMVAEVMRRALAASREHAVWVQTSTVGLAGTRKLAELAGRGYVDAPCWALSSPPSGAS